MAPCSALPASSRNTLGSAMSPQQKMAMRRFVTTNVTTGSTRWRSRYRVNMNFAKESPSTM